MARAKTNGNGRLEHAMDALFQAQATLVQNQAALVAQMTESARRMDEFGRRMDQFGQRMDQFSQRMDATTQRIDETERINSQRFARIETILVDLTHFLERLPEAVREKIGFKVPVSAPQ